MSSPTAAVPQLSPSTGTPAAVLSAQRVQIRWNDALPVFAKEEFLKGVADEYGWFGGVAPDGTLRCILPFTVERRLGLRLVRFRTATIPFGVPLALPEERTFLDGVVDHLRTARADVIVPATNNAIFRTYPTGADAAPYGSYVIDLERPEEVLWKSIGRITRQNIGSAKASGLRVREGHEFLGVAYALTRSTYRRSALPFMSEPAFQRYARALGEHGLLLVTERDGIVQSCTLFGFSRPCAYAIYGGNVPQQDQGSMKLLQWEAIRRFQALGVKRFDFFGARVNPAKGSKQEGINLMKKRLGATLAEGYLWKYPLRPWGARVYAVGARWLKGGDIVDQERYKLSDYRPRVEE